MVDLRSGALRTLSCTALLWTVMLSLGASSAMAEPVTIKTLTGVVQFRQSESSPWRPVTAGMVLPTPVEIMTGPNATTRIVQSGTSFGVNADSRLTLSNETNSPEGLVTRVKQWLGTVFYTVERQPDTFQVETPFLVSTVKGTQFSIVSTDAASFVTLKEGLLEVVNRESGDMRLLRPGDIAGVSADRASINSLKQTPNALTAKQQKLALSLAAASNNLAHNTGRAAAHQKGMEAKAKHGKGRKNNNGLGNGNGVGAMADLDTGTGVDAGLGVNTGSDLGADMHEAIAAVMGNHHGKGTGAAIQDAVDEVLNDHDIGPGSGKGGNGNNGNGNSSNGKAGIGNSGNGKAGNGNNNSPVGNLRP